MSQTSIRRLLTVLAAAVVVVARDAAPLADQTSLPRVRAMQPVVAALVARGLRDSATFRHEVDTIDASDGLVYIGEGFCGHSVLACLTHQVIVAGPHRVLKVNIDLRRPEEETIGALGHELHHAIEVLSDPHITNAGLLVSFFQRVGRTDDGLAFETDAALKTGWAVRDEVIGKMQCGKICRDCRSRPC